MLIKFVRGFLLMSLNLSELNCSNFKAYSNLMTVYLTQIHPDIRGNHVLLHAPLKLTFSNEYFANGFTLLSI